MNCRPNSTPPRRQRWWQRGALLGAAIAAFAGANAQVGTTYSFNQSTGTYTPITGGTVLVTQTTTTTSSAGSLDDGTTYTVPIPFTFTFDGVGYTSCTVTNNGSLSFGGTPIGAAIYSPISTTLGYAGAIVPYGRDLQGGYVFAGTRTLGSNVITAASNTDGVTVGSIISGTSIPAGTTVVSKTATTVTMSANASGTSTGTACWVWNGEMRYQEITPGVFVIQWSNMKPFGTTLATVNGFRMNFQVILNQATGIIQVRYGDCTPGVGVTSTTIGQVGLRGPNNTFPANVNNRRNVKGTNDNWNASTAGTTNADGMLLNTVAPANVIPSGLTYTWSPPSPVISYTPLATTCSLGARTLSANITDPDGVPTAGIGLPVLYWRINAGAYTPATGTFISGSQYDFSFGAGAVAGDVVSYFIVAQDNLGNLNAFPSGATGLTANPPNYTTAPGTPSSYSVGFTLSGNYNVGAGEPAPFNTIGGALGRYNSGCLGGAVTFTLIDASYPSETFPLTINNNPDASATNTLTIKAGTTTSITGNNATAIFLLNGADFVTIDGSTGSTPNTVCPASAATRDLTISNTSTATTSSVVWIASVSGNAATNNTVRNCILTGQGVGTTNVVVGAGGATVGSTPTAAPNNTSIVNNQISTAVFGAFVGGVSAGTKTQNTVVNQNTMSNFSIGGIATPFQNNLTISGNSITGLTNAASADICAINAGYGVTGGFSTTTTGLADGVSNATITNNVIGTVSQTGTFSAAGIALGNSISGTNLIANNMLSGVIANGTGGDFGGGIVIGGGTGSTTNVYYNTVDMKGTVTGSSQPGYALAVIGAATAMDVRNNILLNSQSTGANQNRAFGVNAALPVAWLTMNNNDLFVSGTGSAVAQSTTTAVGGVSHVTLANWQSASGKDAASNNHNPTFISGTDLHIDNTVAGNITNLFNTAAAVSVTNDIDCESRATNNCIGADQFAIPACAGAPATGTTTLVSTPPFCAGATVNMSNNAVNLTSGISYQWQVSGTSGGPYSPVSGGTGATTQNYTTGALTAGTYYYVLEITCSAGPTSALSNEITVVVDPTPTASASSNSPVCTGGTINLDGTTDIGTSFNWTGPGGFASTSEDPSIPAAALINAGVYSFTATLGSCTSAPATTTVVVDVTPTVPSITPPAPAAFCEGGNVVLTASATAASTFTFTGGSMTIPTSGAPGLSTPYPSTVAVSGLPVSGAVLTSVTINGTHTWQNDMDVLLRSPDGTNLIVMSDCGDDATGPDFGPGVYTFVDGGSVMINTGANPPGTYAPTDLGGGGGGGIDTWPAPGPGASPAAITLLSGFTANPNGNWSLFVVDDTSIDGGSITSWSLTFTVNNVTYSWSPATGLNTTVGPVVTAGPTTTQLYTVTAANGANPSCTSDNTVTVTVNPLPVVTCPNDTTVCGNDPVFALTGGSPAGGTYSGPGVSGGNFDASVAGTGTHTITYSFTDVNTCTNTCTFDITVTAPTLWYDDTDGDGFGDPAIDSLACVQPAGFVANDDDDCIAVFGVIGSSCNDNNPFTTGDVLDGTCTCVGTPVPCDNWTLTFNTDASGGDITWQLQDANSPFILASGGPLNNNATESATICVPQGACFVLTVNDAGNNGITGGGWLLTNHLSQRIIDNTGNGGCFTSSSVSVAEAICNPNPAGNDQLIASDCDKLDYSATGTVIASANPAVSAQWGIGDQTDDGYQFWFFDPCGGYSRRIFRNHATSGGFGPANAIRATKLALASIVSNPLPSNVLLNVRVRSRVNGVNSAWGPACRFRIGTIACPTTQLINTINSPNFSCGVTRTFGGSDKVSCFPVTGANLYRFRFERDGGGFTRVITSTTPTRVLNWVTQPLVDGDTYNVTAAASFDNGATWCPYGNSCQVIIDNTPSAQPRSDEAVDADFLMFPNPNRGDQLFLQINDLPEVETLVRVEILDMFGKLVMSATLPTQNGMLNTQLELEQSLTNGMYLVNILAGDRQFTERLVINK